MNEKKKTSKKLKVLILALSLSVILVTGVVVGVVLALQRSSVKSGFQISVIGGRHVEATINASSYISSKADPVQVLGEIKFEKDTEVTPVNLNFTENIEIDNLSDYVTYKFEIKNIASTNSYTDLIIEPVVEITTGSEHIMCNKYVSVDDTDYDALTDKYITVAKGKTVYVAIQINVSDTAIATSEDFNYAGNIEIKLYSERGGMPADYEPNYVYTYVAAEGVSKAKVYVDGTTATPVALSANEYVVATPATAQSVIDGNINGKVVVFTAGEYNDALDFRPTWESGSKVIDINGDALDQYISELTPETIITNAADKQFKSTGMTYERNFTDVVFMAEDGANFNNVWNLESATVFQSGKIFALMGQKLDMMKGGAVVKTDSTSSGTVPAYISVLNYNNVKFLGLNFVGKTAKIHMDLSTSKVCNDVAFIGCSFVNNDTISEVEAGTHSELVGKTEYYNFGSNLHGAAVFVGSAPVGVVNNISFVGNTVSGYTQGFHVVNATNVTVTDNTITKTAHNAIAIQSSATTYATGLIVIANNNISNTNEVVYAIVDGVATGAVLHSTDEGGDRAIRFNKVQNANIIITGNTFTGSVTTVAGELSKSGALTNVSMYFVGNTYAGAALEDVISTKTSFLYVIE